MTHHDGGIRCTNPDFARYAELCGAQEIQVRDRGEIESALASALDHDGPSLVGLLTDTELF